MRGDTSGVSDNMNGVSYTERSLPNVRSAFTPKADTSVMTASSRKRTLALWWLLPVCGHDKRAVLHLGRRLSIYFLAVTSNGLLKLQ